MRVLSESNMGKLGGQVEGQLGAEQTGWCLRPRDYATQRPRYLQRANPYLRLVWAGPASRGWTYNRRAMYSNRQFTAGIVVALLFAVSLASAQQKPASVADTLGTVG